MDLDRPHFPTSTATTELFICFTSRLSSSSSSMKLTKSILSPGRAARDAGPVSLSSSLSRRLRTNGSLKGGQGQASPFISTTGKKRGCGAFENPEPSSPKVTCIGQVRVKTKKKVKQQRRSLSRRRSGGEVSFRKIDSGSNSAATAAADEDKICSNLQQQRHNSNGGSGHYQECLPPHRNQKWVHLPVSICEAVRAFGAEFSCLFPCKSSSSSSCFSAGERDDDYNDKGEKPNESNSINNGGCGAVFARWLVSVNDGEGGKRREIELVVGGGDDEEEEEKRKISMRSSRRHVFEDIEVKDDRVEVKGAEVEEEAGRVSICIPPKNALLLMRCRSDPMKMAALANKFSWDAHSSSVNHDVDDDKNNDVDEEIKKEETVEDEVVEDKDGEVIEEDVIVTEGEASLEMEVVEEEQETLAPEELGIDTEELVQHQEEEEEEEEEEEVESNMSSFEALLDQEIAEPYQDCPQLQLQQDDEEQAAEEDAPICRLPSHLTEDEVEIQSNQTAPPLDEEEEEEDDDDEEVAVAPMQKESEATAEELVNNHEENQFEPQPEEEKSEAEAEAEAEAPIYCEEEDSFSGAPEMEKPENPELVANKGEQVKTEKGNNPVLPECLLLMMCEPKLSMEVSKETWVCSTDFVRWLPERPRRSARVPRSGSCCDHDPVKRRLSADSKPKENNNHHPQQQPPRSSCSSMTTMIEQKLVNAVGYEPFVLTRCKSEPMRTAAAKLVPVPESCCWKNSIRKQLEPHRRATLGVGAAGVGF